MNIRQIYKIYPIPVCKVNQNLTKTQEQFLHVNNLILQSLVWSKNYGPTIPSILQNFAQVLNKNWLIKANNTVVKNKQWKHIKVINYSEWMKSTFPALL